MQLISNFDELLQYFVSNDCHRLFLVHDNAIKYYDEIVKFLNDIVSKGISVISFDAFQSNPLYENVVDAVKICRESNCDGVLAIGGGSAIDIAKCVKLWMNETDDGSNGKWLVRSNVAEVPFGVVPMTAGTGSEATRYAVIYYEGKKQSVTNDKILPSVAYLNPRLLRFLPDYQKKSCMLDALCHGIESLLSINRTVESIEYSNECLRLIKEHAGEYLAGNEESSYFMLQASNFGGRAINITQTTAGHAMSYKLTSMFGISHGHAAFLCNIVLFDYMSNFVMFDTQYDLSRLLNDIFIYFDGFLGCHSIKDVLNCLNLSVPFISDENLKILVRSVNPDRLKNHPVKLTEQDFNILYKNIDALRG